MNDITVSPFKTVGNKPQFFCCFPNLSTLLLCPICAWSVVFFASLKFCKVMNEQLPMCVVMDDIFPRNQLDQRYYSSQSLSQNFWTESLESFLTYSQQTAVSLFRVFLCIMKLFSDIPQHSVLSLFSLYTTDLYNSIRACKMQLYADDIRAYVNLLQSP